MMPDKCPSWSLIVSKFAKQERRLAKLEERFDVVEEQTCKNRSFVDELNEWKDTTEDRFDEIELQITKKTPLQDLEEAEEKRDD